MDPLNPQPEMTTDPLTALTPQGNMQNLDTDAIKRRSSMLAFAGLVDDEPAMANYESLMDLHDQRQKIMQDTISVIGDTEARKELQVKALGKTVRNLSNIAVQKPESYDTIQQAATLAISRQAAERESAAAERAWAENLQLLSDQERNGLYDLTVLDKESPTLFDEQVKIMSIRAEIMQAIEDNKIDMEDRGWFWSVVDWGMSQIPFSTTWANSDNFDAEVTRWYDGIFSGERKAQEADNWWTAMLRAPSDTKRKEIMNKFIEGLNNNTNFMFGQNKMIKETVLNELNARQNVLGTNLWDGMLNSEIILGTGYKAFKVPFKVTNTLKAFKINKLAADRTIKAIEEIQTKGAQEAEKTTGMGLAEVEDNILPPSINPNIERSGAVKDLTPNIDPVSTEVGFIWEEGLKEMKELFGDLIFTERLTDAERAKVRLDYIQRAEQLGQKPKGKSSGTQRKVYVLDSSAEVKTTEVATGQYLHHFEAVLGRKARAGEELWYESEAKAKQAARQYSMMNEQVEVEPGKWGNRIAAPIDEGAEALAGGRVYDPFKEKQTGGAWSWLMKHAGGKLAAAEELHGLAAISHDKKNKILKIINDEIMPSFARLSDAERFVLRHTLAGGERISTWFSRRELESIYKANFPDKDPAKFVDAYTQAWRMNDHDYILRNIEELVQLSASGHTKLEFSGISGPGKVLRKTKTIPQEVIIRIGDDPADLEIFVDTAEEGQSFRAGRQFTRPRMSLNDLQTHQRNGYQLVRMHQPQKVMMGSKAAYSRYFLVKGSNILDNPLDYNIIPYKAGGHRMYRGRYFAKLPSMREQPWGERILDKPFTPTVAISKADGDAWVAEANAIMRTYKEAKRTGMPEADMLRLMQDQIEDASMSFPHAEEMVEWFVEHGTDHEFELVFDRELPSAYRKQGVFSMVDDGLSGVNTFLDTQGQMYKSPKGDILKDVNDWNKDGAETIDPFQILNRALTNVARLTSFTDFKLRAVNKWMATYAQALDVRDLPDVNPMRIFMDGQFDTRTKQGKLTAQQGETQRAYIKRILGWKSDADLAAEAAGRNLAETVGGWFGRGKASRLVQRTQNWWTETRPVNALMGWAFDSTMGFWNPGQFPLQIQTSFAAVTIDPTRGAAAMGNMPALALYMRKGATEADLKQFVRWGWHKLAGYDDPESYMNMLRTLKRSGYMENMVSTMKNEMGPNAALGNIGRGIEAVRNNGRIFVDSAEEWNRAIAWQIAWKRVKEMPEYAYLKEGSAAHTEKVRSLAGTFAFNMDEAGAAWWQKNALAKLPTQFMGYMVRWHEMLWNKDFKRILGKEGAGLKSEKIRFVLGQYALYGFAGIPFLAGFMQDYERKTGEVADINTVQGLLSRGLIDYLTYKGTGLDVAFSERAGIGAYPTDIIGELFGYSKYGEVAAADLALGATYQIGKDATGAIGRMFFYMAAESGGDLGGPLTQNAVMSVLRHVSTFNNYQKMQAILAYGTYTNRYGQHIGQNLPSTYAFAAALGYNPGQMRKLTAELAWLEDNKKAAKDWSKQILIFRQEVADAISIGDYKRADEVSEAVNFLTRVIIPQDIRPEALAEADKANNMESIVESVARRVEKEQNENNIGSLDAPTD